jgi:hypothetical protein
MFLELLIACFFRAHIRNHGCAIADPRACRPRALLFLVRRLKQMNGAFLSLFLHFFVDLLPPTRRNCGRRFVEAIHLSLNFDDRMTELAFVGWRKGLQDFERSPQRVIPITGKFVLIGALR